MRGRLPYKNLFVWSHVWRNQWCKKIDIIIQISNISKSFPVSLRGLPWRVSRPAFTNGLKKDTNILKGHILNRILMVLFNRKRLQLRTFVKRRVFSPPKYVPKTPKLSKNNAKQICNKNTFWKSNTCAFQIRWCRMNKLKN